MALKVYYATSVRGAGRDLDATRKAIETIRELGHIPLTEHLAEEKVDKPLTDREVYERDMSLLKQADLLIADVTFPSLGVGYEICEALHQGKPIYLIAREGVRISKLVAGISQVRRYSDLEELASLIRQILSSFV